MDMNILQDALIRDLAALFKDFKLHSSINEESSLRIYRQFIPIRVGEDEDPETYIPPEPYIQVKLADGELNDRDERQTVNVILMIGVCDHDPNRQGYDYFKAGNSVQAFLETDTSNNVRYWSRSADPGKSTSSTGAYYFPIQSDSPEFSISARAQAYIRPISRTYFRWKQFGGRKHFTGYVLLLHEL